MKTLTYNPENFNNLPTIEEADAHIRNTSKLALALNFLGPIFLKHRMEKTWGICVLHKHFRINSYEIPLQEVQLEKGKKVYITSPKTQPATAIFPAIVKINLDNSIIPIEYSNDTSAMLANIELQNNSEFIEELYHTMVDHKIDKDFGLIYGRKIGRGAELVEFNYDGRISKLEEVDIANNNHSDLTQTSWFFSFEESEGKCKSRCFSRCPTDHAPTHAPYHDPNG